MRIRSSLFVPPLAVRRVEVPLAQYSPTIAIRIVTMSAEDISLGACYTVVTRRTQPNVEVGEPGEILKRLDLTDQTPADSEEEIDDHEAKFVVYDGPVRLLASADAVTA